jgi:hypothetical protein
MSTPLYGAPGFRFYKDLYPNSREGGLSYYPYSSIISGLALQIAAIAPSAPVALSGIAPLPVTIKSGRAYLDSLISNLASDVILNLDPVASAGNMPPLAGVNKFDIFLNPTRKLQMVPVGGTPPTTLLNGDPVKDGDLYATAVDDGESFVTKDFYQLQGGIWSSFDPTFSAPTIPAQRGRNRTFGNDAYPKVSLSNVSVNAIEKEIYVGTMYPHYTSSNSKAVLRKSASLFLGTVSLFYYVLPVPITANVTSGSASVVVSVADAAKVNALVLAASNADDFALSGSSSVGAGTIAANGWNNSTRTLTLSAPAASTANEVTLNIIPAAPGTNYLISPTLSEVILSDNLSNP